MRRGLSCFRAPRWLLLVGPLGLVTLAPASSAAESAPAPKTSPSVATTKVPPAKKTPPAANKSAKAVTKAAPQAPTSAPRASTAKFTPKQNADPATRRKFAGGPTADDVAFGPESPELRALRDAERELFPPAMPASGAWPSELGSPLSSATPRVHASGLPPAPVPSAPPVPEGGKDISWISKLALPDLPVRWDARVVRYLEFYKDDPRGHQLLSAWFKRSGRYRDAIRRVLKQKNLPEDLLFLALAESTFDPTIRSPAGAAGLWQFMPDTARAYGLSLDRWADQRLNPTAATEAAAEHLSDLHRRFGSWELAMAGYNMGYGGVQAVVRRYNSNDFWVLSRLEGALPWETTLYVPKILATAIVSRNMQTFGFGELEFDAPLDGEIVPVPPGVALASVATAAGCTQREIEQLNPELRTGRTPPAAANLGDYPVRVPRGKGDAVTSHIALLRKSQPAAEMVTVRFGETVEQIAAARKVPLQKVIELNGLASGEVVRPGTVLLVPKGLPPTTEPATDKPAIAVIPADVFVYPDRRRVFYRVVTGDTLKDIAQAFSVSVDEVRRWNELDPAARLVEGMTLQVFAPLDAELSKVATLAENQIRPVVVGSDEFFSLSDALKGRKRLVVAAQKGETLEKIGQRYGVSPASMERINRKNRSDVLREGETVVLYIDEKRALASSAPPPSTEDRYPNFVEPPFPDQLPAIPPSQNR